MQRIKVENSKEKLSEESSCLVQKIMEWKPQQPIPLWPSLDPFLLKMLLSLPIQLTDSEKQTLMILIANPLLLVRNCQLETRLERTLKSTSIIFSVSIDVSSATKSDSSLNLGLT